MGIISEFLDKKVQFRNFVQVGAFDGNDEFREMVLKYKPEKTLLIEPNKDMISLITENYTGIKGVIIENVAVVAQPGEDVELYLPRTDEFGKAENGLYYDSHQYSLVPMNDWGEKEDMQTIHARGATMMFLLRKHDIRNIDYFCLDTEGYDVEILKSMDLWKHQVDILQYEKWGFDSTLFARHNSNWDDLGDKAMDTMQGILSLMGYKLYEEDNNVIAITNRQEVWKTDVQG